MAIDGIWALGFGKVLVVSRTAQGDSFFNVSANSIVHSACPPSLMQLSLSLYFLCIFSFRELIGVSTVVASCESSW